ncbi:hypothetical protein [Flavobacterium pallidum]|nr:hypothetical protein [Flavobacterium pallidum]
MLRSDPQFLNANFTGDTAMASRYSEREIGIRNFPWDTVLPRYDLKVIIDTTYHLFVKGYVYERMPFPFRIPWDTRPFDGKAAAPLIKAYFEREKFQKQKYISSYPVLIFNPSQQTAYVSEGNFMHFQMIQEALDSDGKWKPIDFQWSDDGGGCIPINLHYKLLPRHYIGASVIKYSGDFKTKIRVKMKSGNDVYYSNEITGHINHSQFNQDFIGSYLENRTRPDAEYFEFHKARMFLNNLPQKCNKP